MKNDVQTRCKDCQGMFPPRTCPYYGEYQAYLCKECFHKREAEKGCSHCKGTVDPYLLVEPGEYHVNLCLSCVHKLGYHAKGHAFPVCEGCKDQYQDPAIKHSTTPYVHFHRQLNQYLCDWCLMQIGDFRFTVKRIPKYTNQWQIDRARLGFSPERVPLYWTDLSEIDWEAAKKRLGIAKNFKGAQSQSDDTFWFTEGVYGSEIDEKWKHYYIRYYSYRYHTFENPVTLEKASQLLPYASSDLHLHSSDRRIVLKTYKAQVFYKYSLAFLEFYFEKSYPPTSSQINLEHIDNETARENEVEKKMVDNGLKLFLEITENRAGRAQDSGMITEKNKEAALEFIILKGKELLSSTGEITKHRLDGVLKGLGRL